MDATILDKWAEAVNKGNLEEILKFYGENSVLIPTFSEGVIHSKEGIREYFEMLGKKKELEVSIIPESTILQKTGVDIDIYSGIYRWRIVDQEEISYDARFSFVIMRGEPSVILQHHSSQEPQVV